MQGIKGEAVVAMLASRTRLSCLVDFLRSLRTSSVAKRGRLAGDGWKDSLECWPAAQGCRV